METKHSLVQYQGGGYDGCFWEWNYFYIAADGLFHDVFSSGRNGCDTMEKAQALLAGDDETKYIYDMTSEKQIEEFCRESAMPNVLGVFKWFWNHEVDEDTVHPFFICSVCDCRIDDEDDGILEDFHGCGGIAITADSLLCLECHSLGICDNCGEYVGADEIPCLVAPMEFDDDFDGGYQRKAAAEFIDDGCSACWDCIKDRAAEVQAEELQDMQWQSFATGKPDMFSESMREFWLS